MWWIEMMKSLLSTTNTKKKTHTQTTTVWVAGLHATMANHHSSSSTCAISIYGKLCVYLCAAVLILSEFGRSTDKWFGMRNAISIVYALCCDNYSRYSGVPKIHSNNFIQLLIVIAICTLFCKANKQNLQTLILLSYRASCWRWQMSMVLMRLW